MAGQFTVYGAQGSGSVPIEAALSLIGIPYDVIDGDIVQGAARNTAANRINPLNQVPVLVLPGGEVMTESAAILIYLADRFPQAHLAPAVGDARRSAFLRWMVYISAAIYGLAWVRCDPSRLVGPAGPTETVLDRIGERRSACWQHMDSQIVPGRFLLGDELSVLDLYVATVSRWSPRRNQFYRIAPRMGDVVRQVDQDPRLAHLWKSRFPFNEGWE